MFQEPRKFILEHIRKMESYQPGLQTSDQNIIKLNTNENPFEPIPEVLEAMENAVKKGCLRLYPNPTSSELRKEIAQHYKLKSEQVLLGNGSDEVLRLVLQGTLGKTDTLLMCEPSYSLYPILVASLNANLEKQELKENWHCDWEGLEVKVKENFQRIKIVVIVNPNAPTGIAEKKEKILHFAQTNPTLTLIDEAYGPFANESVASFAGSESQPRLLVSCSFSKGYSLASQRIGFLLGHPDFIEELDKLRDSYNLSYLAQLGALATWKHRKLYQKKIEIIVRNREYLSQHLGELGFYILPSSANFIFTSPPQNLGSAKEYKEFLEKKNILIRYFAYPPKVVNFVRISIGSKQDLDKLIEASREWIGKN